MADSSVSQTQFLRNVVRDQGRDASGFEAATLPNGSVRVLGPRAAAVYPHAGWVERFVAHLQQGYFDGHPPTVRAKGAVSAAGGTG